MPSEKLDNSEPKDLFIRYKTQPLVKELSNLLKETENLGKGQYFLKNKSSEHKIISRFLVDTLKNLPFNNEVGSTVLMRQDSKKVINELSSVLEEKKDWKEISWIYNGHLYEVFKNEIYPKHNLNSAICYSIDLSSYPNDPQANGFLIERIFMNKNNDGVLTGKYDGKFYINSSSISVDLNDSQIFHIH